MGRRVNEIVAWSPRLLVFCLLAGGPATAQVPKEPPATRWIPSLAITGGATFQDQSSSVSSMCQVGGFGLPPSVGNCSGYPDGFPVAGPGPAPLRPERSGSERAVSPFVGGSLQLLTPAIPIPTRPRFFIQGEILPTFATDRNIAAEGDPDGVSAPLAQNTGFIEGPLQFSQPEFVGVGSRTTSTVETLVYGASAGLAFPFELLGRRLWLKPSVGWLRYEVQVEGTVEAGLKDDIPLIPGPNTRDCTFVPNPAFPGPPGVPTPQFLAAPCSGIGLSGSDSLWLQGVGPGLALELDAARWGPIGASLYIDAAAYKILGDRDLSFTSSVTYDTNLGRIPADTYTANWSFSADPWIYRAGVGIRFSWLGRPGR
jgi:hypothetical protein